MKLTFIACLCLIFSFSTAQNLSSKDLLKFQKAESILKEYTDGFNVDSLSFEERVKLIHDFIPRFVAILEEKNSFYYPFDSLLSLEKVVAPDDAFKIYTWQLKEPLGTHKYYGAIQMNSKNLELYPLFDYSDTMIYQPQNKLSHTNWYGGLYYNCLLNESNGVKQYTLLGYDEADFVSKRKFVEPISFNAENKPVFGDSIIEFRDSLGVLIDIKSRFFIEYSDKATCKLNYDPAHEMIVYDHVVPPSDDQKEAKFTYVPDGTYEGLQFENGKWRWVERVFHYSIGLPDSPPMPHPVHDGNKSPLFGN